MIIYEVNLEIDSTIFEEYSRWLDDHIKKMILFKGFKKARTLEELNPDCNNSRIHTLVVQYEVDTMENLQEYFDHHAFTMRKESMDLFGEKVRPTRVVYKVKNFSKE